MHFVIFVIVMQLNYILREILSVKVDFRVKYCLVHFYNLSFYLSIPGNISLRWVWSSLLVVLTGNVPS